MKGGLRRLRVEGRDLVELFLVPGLAAVLPWRWCFALYKKLASWRFLYGTACEQALAEARVRGWAKADSAGNGGITGEEAFLRTRRLVTLVDHADLFLARFRSDAWMKRHLSVEGVWPEVGTGVLLYTFHWGAGMWGLRHAAAQGLTPNALAIKPKQEQFAGRRVAWLYARKRNVMAARPLRRPVLDVAADLRLALRALRAGEPVIVAADVPADQVEASEQILFLGMPAHVPRAFFRLAVERRIPAVVYLTGIRMTDGERFLRIRTLGVRDSVEELIAAVFAELEQAVREEPAAWHFWGVAERFFASDPSVSAQQPALEV